MSLKIIFPMLAAVCAEAQTTCPPINFLNAKTINLNPTASSHLVLLRQSGGSYTAFEVANASPYGVLRRIPHFERQFSNCLPRTTSPATGKASSPAPNAPGVAAQAVAYAVLDSGNYLFVSADFSGSLDVTVFDQNLHFISEQYIGTLPPDPNRPGSVGSYLSLVLVDVNGDSKLDVVAQYETAAGSGGGVSVFLGNGSGGFQPAGGFPIAGFVNGSMAVADLNGDGKPDIVAGAPPDYSPFAQGSGTMVVALGKGDGTFVTSTFATPNEIGPVAIAIADLNGDGKNDLVFLTCAETGYMPNEAVVMLGNGDGTFGPGAVFPVTVAGPLSPYGGYFVPGAIAVGDMNGDGIPDIVTNGITILLGDGKGGYPARKDFLNTDETDSVILDDFDGDGKMDVLIGAGDPLFLSQSLSGGADTLTVFFGDGSGGLAAAPQALSPNPAPAGSPDIVMTSGDFNKDGIADLAYVSDYQYLSVFLGSASGTVTSVFSYDFTLADQQANRTSVVAADFNQDGILDLAVSVAAVSVASPSSPGSILVFLGKGDGTFLPPVSSSAPGSTCSLVTGDFNKDGHADLAAINCSASPGVDQLVVFLGKGDGTFLSSQTYPAGPQASLLVAGDFNHDGFDDLAIGNQAGINLFLGKADGTLSPGANIAFPAVLQSLVTADLRGDGNLDLITGLQGDGLFSGGIAILLGHGDGTFGLPAIYLTGPFFTPELPPLVSVAVGDFNGDGIPDLLVNDATFYIGNGDGTFQLQTIDLPGTFGPLIAADFNGDGKLDVASGVVVSVKGRPGISFYPVRRGPAIFYNLSHPTALLSVVSAADFSAGPVSPHSIASAFGKHLALSTASGTPPLLPTTLGGASVSVQDQTGTVSQAEIYYASPGQVNFVLPAEIESGSAIVSVATTDGQSASTEVQIASNPKIFLADPSGIPAGYVVRVGADNVQAVEPIFIERGGHVQEVPIDVSTGDVFLILFGTGFDAPPSATGSFSALSGNYVSFTATYAGPQSQFPGLDQVNIPLATSLAGMGRVSFAFDWGGQQNLYITIK